MSDAATNLPQTILYIDHTAKLGGGEIALLNLATHLDRTRYTPVVLLFSDGPLADKLRAAGVETHILPLSSDVLDTRKDSLGTSSLMRFREALASLGAVWRVARFIRKRQPAIVHTNSLKSDLIGGPAARLARKPLIWHVRDRIDEQYLPRKVVKIFRMLARIIPTCVVANSRSTLETLHLPRCKMTGVVYSGIDIRPYERPDRAAPAPDPMRPHIGLVGRIARWKGQHVFIQAAAQVQKQFPGSQFHIIGSALFEEADYEREIRSLVCSLGLDSAVHFDGFRADVSRAIADLDLLVHASITGEPFGQVIVEGMAAQKPVVATAGGGVLEIVDDGQTGWLVPMGDAAAMAQAICRVLSDPQRAAQIAQAGQRRVFEHFTIAASVQAVDAIYRSLTTASDCVEKPASSKNISPPYTLA